MLAGRSYRKLISQSFAFGIYRWIVIWLIIAICASKGTNGEVAALVVIAINITSSGTFKGVAFALNEMSRNNWRDHLTGRFLDEKLWLARKEGSADIDFESLSAAARQEAIEDIRKAEELNVLESLDSTAWHWFGGFLSFIWLVISDFLYYGTAFYVGVVSSTSGHW